MNLISSLGLWITHFITGLVGHCEINVLQNGIIMIILHIEIIESIGSWNLLCHVIYIHIRAVMEFVIMRLQCICIFS